MGGYILKSLSLFVEYVRPLTDGLPLFLVITIRVALLILILILLAYIPLSFIRSRLNRLYYKEGHLKERGLLSSDTVLKVKLKKGLLGLNLRRSLTTDEIQNNHLDYLGEIYNKKFLEVKKFRRDSFFYLRDEGVPEKFDYKEIERLKLGEMELMAGKTLERKYKIDLMRISGLMISIPTGAGKSTLTLALLYIFIFFNKEAEIIIFDSKSGADYRQFKRTLFPNLKIFNPLITEEFKEGMELLEGLQQKIIETQNEANEKGIEVKNHLVLKRKKPELVKYKPTILVFDELPRYSNPQTEYDKERRELVAQFANFVNRATATYRSSLVKVIGITQRPNRDEMPAIKLGNFLVKILGEVSPNMNQSLGGLPSNYLGRKDFINGKFLFMGDDGTIVVVRTPYIGDSDNLKPKPLKG